MNDVRRAPRPGGFTLVEILVVVIIVILVSAVTLPTILPALNHRQVSEAARILQAGLAGAHDAAIRNNAPRGIRLFPDPAFSKITMLAYNRFVPIEPADDYGVGRCRLTAPPTGIPPVSTNPTSYFEGPVVGTGYTPMPPLHPALRIEEDIFDTNGLPNERVSWFWNIRIGDKIRIDDSGRYYTVVGPALINPLMSSPAGQNPELFVNDAPPGAPLSGIPVLDAMGNPVPGPDGNPLRKHYLYVVNGEDDDNDGYVDDGWDGFNNNYNQTAAGAPIVDEYEEWETEDWVGPHKRRWGSLSNLKYTIVRRPVPSQGAREVTLPSGVVIDATTWNSTQERSRLPFDAKLPYVDVLVNIDGTVIQNTEYSTPTATGIPFYQFWIAERQDVHDATELSTQFWSGGGNPNAPTQNFLLPLPQGSYTASPAPTVYLRGDRRLITLFPKTGNILTNTVENFDPTDINKPYYDAQSGTREAK